MVGDRDDDPCGRAARPDILGTCSIGTGGVYEADHIEIGRRVAVKLVQGLHAGDQHIAARIKQEARSTSAIDSENIVQVSDVGEDEELNSGRRFHPECTMVPRR